MSATILDGKALSAKIKQQIKEEASLLAQKGITPALAVIIVGDNPASRVYVNNKKKACEECGFISEEYALPVLDLFAFGGIQPKYEEQRVRFCPDGLHPNDEGHKIIARKLIAFLKNQ